MGSFNDSRNTLWDHELSGVRKRGETPQSKRWREGRVPLQRPPRRGGVAKTPHVVSYTRTPHVVSYTRTPHVVSYTRTPHVVPYTQDSSRRLLQ